MAAEYYTFVLGKPGKFIDRTGVRQHRLVAIRPMRRTGSVEVYWECQCDCGNIVMVRAASLAHGQKSCGCQQREMAIKTLLVAGVPHRIKPRHGHTRHGSMTPAYARWQGIKGRCDDEKDERYPYYGGRGISYDPRWEIFENFLADMGEPPPGMQIDRINNDGNYTKENCRWVTPRENANNRRNTSFVEFRGRRVTISNLASEIGIACPTLRARLKSGWPVEKAATTKVRGN